MQKVYPCYYKSFRCIADKCIHNCCIGWEIDIDPATADFYKTTDCSLKSQFREHINFSGNPAHFILQKDERCPFLNNRNLCDIITTLGDEHLCTICAEHPRFHNELPGRLESGLGMCCEEAARLILSQKEPVSLIYEGNKDCEDEIIHLRDQIISILQNRSTPLPLRISQMLRLCKATPPHTHLSEWSDIFLSLERLDEGWTDMVLLLKNNIQTKQTDAFNLYMQGREAEYEQLCVYLIYRHLANAPDMHEAKLRAKFAALSCLILRNIALNLYSRNNHFTFEEQVDLCRMFSAEIEYSDENLYALLDQLE